mgnify:CR=1 FL=1
MRQWIAFAALILAGGVYGQSPQATINGSVTDSQGALIVGVEVSATSAGTGVKTVARTNEAGVYSLRFLPIGADAWPLAGATVIALGLGGAFGAVAIGLAQRAPKTESLLGDLCALCG